MATKTETLPVIMDDILFYVIVGFLAQMIDGAIGMAYGVTATSVLLSAGVPPATASACVHAAETFTTGASGAAHWKLGNVDRKLLWRLAVPGAIGGAIGAYVLSEFPGDTLKPFIAAYLLLLGLVIIWKALGARQREGVQPRTVAPLGFFGGLLDAMGGGGWGPIVTSSLLGQGATPRYAIGSVNLAEFFVTLTISATFFVTIGLSLWPIILGLIIGGVIAAPFAALAAKHIPAKVLMLAVGCVVVLLSMHTIYRVFI
ncbi:MAG TPA: sulfite exporter TauE/SafE family protein [Hyphomicrobium sp.]|uniref:sulfite exporter TauE/SafE family protein n=2 Tax=Hyphomicrobium sp. TaxID=82 RepID=UPI002BCBED89|nr:sulfite exporter TauE/SafE family protein [Hyphomicrobium sp.]HRN88752.1 sulfite exporter TauE/SafE family protein [Hyphomicrobium sp.]HRQ27726.1 sulfite exporter TauE/SafE family protein [Hyphomicrobium sp.]